MGRTVTRGEKPSASEQHRHCEETAHARTHARTRVSEHAHAHMPTICLHAGCFLGQLCGGQARSHWAGWEAQARPDGVHLHSITTHQAGWTHPLRSKTRIWNG